MSRAMEVVRGLLLSAAILPGVAMASLTAPILDFGEVVQGTAVTKSVTVTGQSGYHYIMGVYTSGAPWVTAAPGTCPSGASSGTVSTCQISVTLAPSNSTTLGSGLDVVSYDYKFDDMPFNLNGTGWDEAVLPISLRYTILEAEPAMPVPLMPSLFLLLLAGLLALFGISRVRASK